MQLWSSTEQMIVLLNVIRRPTVYEDQSQFVAFIVLRQVPGVNVTVPPVQYPTSVVLINVFNFLRPATATSPEPTGDPVIKAKAPSNNKKNFMFTPTINFIFTHQFNELEDASFVLFFETLPHFHSCSRYAHVPKLPYRLSNFPFSPIHKFQIPPFNHEISPSPLSPS